MWPQRWLTPVSGLDQAVARPSATPTPTRRQPTRPGPRVTATRSRSEGWTAAFSRAWSRRCGSRSRWSRAASSGTTPPNSRCSSTWEWMTLARIRRPSSTTATEVSSQLVSMPRVSNLLSLPLTLTLSRVGRGESVSLREEVAAEAADFGFDPLQVGLVGLAEARGVDRVRPHHDRVFAIVRVVTLAPPDDLEAEGLVHPHRVVIAGPNLERHPLGAHVVGGLDEAGENDPSVPAVLEVAPDPDRGDVGLVVHPPHAAVADDRRIEVGDPVPVGSLHHPVLAKHDVVGAGARRQLPVVGVPGPGSGENLALDLLDRVDVGLPHQLQDELLPELDHYFLEAENVCMYSISRLP